MLIYMACTFFQVYCNDVLQYGLWAALQSITEAIKHFKTQTEHTANWVNIYSCNAKQRQRTIKQQYFPKMLKNTE